MIFLSLLTSSIIHITLDQKAKNLKNPLIIRVKKEKFLNLIKAIKRIIPAIKNLWFHIINIFLFFYLIDGELSKDMNEKSSKSRLRWCDIYNQKGHNAWTCLSKKK